MEAKMKHSYLFMSAALLVPAAAFAQMSDADYCKALTQQYQKYVANIATGKSPQPAPVDVQSAIAQCQAGNTAAGIPVLEQKLRDAKIDLPKRG
jgi:hypothetical protein